MNVLKLTTLIVSTVVIAVVGSGRFAGKPLEKPRGDLSDLPPPAWNTAPAAQITYRNKGDYGDLDPRGSVRYNIAPNGRIMRGIITKQREVSVEDGVGLEQAKEPCCYPDSYPDPEYLD